MNMLNMDIGIMQLMKKMKATLHIFLAVALLGGSINYSYAASLIKDLGGEAGFGEISQGRNDDGSSGLIELGTGFPNGINFFGKTFHSLYINNNGNVTFGGTVSTFTPSSFPISSYPMIAPYWGDVDTRASAAEPEFNNRVYYGYTADNKFVVTWYYVGYYAASANKLNAFQLILSDRSDVSSGDFDVEFRYEQLEWTTGAASGGSNGLGGVPAQVGFDAGDRENFYQHPDSQTADILQLVNTSNINENGVWLFQIRSGVITEPPKSALHDVTLKLHIPHNNISIDSDSFTVEPSKLVEDTESTVVEWFFETFHADQIKNLDFDLNVSDLQPNEIRTIITKLALNYIDANGNDVYKELGEQTLEVMSSVFELSIATDRLTYSANQIVGISSQVSNLSQISAATTLNISVRDENESVITNILSMSALDFEASEVKAIDNLQFSVGNTYVGQYQVYATLRNVNGDIIEEASSPFEIVLPTVAQASAQVSTNKIAYAPYEVVHIDNRVRNPAPNALLDNANAKTTVYTPNNDVLWTSEISLPQISAQGLYDFSSELPLEQADSGQYKVKLEVTNSEGSMLASSETMLTVQSTGSTGSGLLATIEAVPNSVFKTESLVLDVTLTNKGNAALENLLLTLAVVDINIQEVIEQWEQEPSSLSINGQLSFDEQWLANVQATHGYAAILSTVVGGNEIVLATQALTVKEKVFTTLNSEGKGRLLVLLDDLGNAQVCQGISQIDMVYRPNTVILPSDEVIVELFDEQGALIDSETLVVNDFTSTINDNTGTSIDISLINASADNIKVRLQSIETGTALNGAVHRISVSHLRSGVQTLSESPLFSTACYGLSSGQELTADIAIDDVQGLDETDPYGPDGSPTKLTQRRFLEALLNDAGWSYTITDNMNEYVAELQSSTYTVTALFNEQLKLPESAQQELVNRVEQGLGLLYAGYHDKRNGRIEPALGIKVNGKLSSVTGVELYPSVINEASETLSFNVDTKPLSAELVGAVSIAKYQQGNLSDEPAITTYSYGSGRSIYMGFDVLVQATIAGQESLYSQLMQEALSYVHPPEIIHAINSVVPIAFKVKNVGSNALGQAVFTLPSGVRIVDSGQARELNDGKLLWPFKLATDEEKELQFWVELPGSAGSIAITGNIAVATENVELVDYSSVSLSINVSNQ